MEWERFVVPYSVDWYVPDRIVLFCLIGDLTMEDIAAINGVVQDYVDSSTSDIVHLIYDDSQLGELLGPLPTIVEALTVLRDPRVQWVLAAGQVDAGKNFTGVVIAQKYGVKHRRFDRVEEAATYLFEHDLKLQGED